MILFIDSDGRQYAVSQVKFGTKMHVAVVSAGKLEVEVSGRPEVTLEVTRYSTHAVNKITILSVTAWVTRTVTKEPQTETKDHFDIVWANAGQVTKVNSVGKTGGSTIAKDISATREVTREVTIFNPTADSSAVTRERTVTPVI